MPVIDIKIKIPLKTSFLPLSYLAMERISDYSLGLSGTLKKIHKDDFKQKSVLPETLAPVNQGLYGLLSALTDAYENENPALARNTVREAAKLVSKIKRIKKENLLLLRKGNAEAEDSVYLSDYLTISRRVAEHSANIAESLMQPAVR